MPIAGPRQLIVLPCQRFLSLLIVAMISAPFAVAYTPDDEVVQSIVDRGVRHLEKAMSDPTHYELGRPFNGGWGEYVLAGYAHFKVEHDEDSPVVKRGIESALSIAHGLSGTDPGGNITTTNYNAGVTAMLLADVDKVKYRKELEDISSYFKRAQGPGGGYCYKGIAKGDTSQIQYAMLGLWTVDRAGVQVDYQSVVRTATWLIRSQDVDGAWPYHGEETPGPNRIKQATASTSMAVAGGSAVLIAGDILRAWGSSTLDDPQIEGLPKAVRLQLEERQKSRIPQIPTEPLIRSLDDLQTYLSRNSAVPGAAKIEWPYYQLYTLERYESFRESAFEGEKNPSPAWYNGGVDYLKKIQDANGGWTQSSHMTSSVNTAFAVLFLIRSTQKTIDQASKGSMRAGYGLPKDTSTLTRVGTQLKGEPVAESVDQLLGLLDADNANEVDSNSIPENLKLAQDPNARRIQLDRLERLVRGSSSWQARRVAARLLGQSDELRVVPALIFALSDGDTYVRGYASDGLCFISRKFEGVGMPASPQPDELRKAQKAWRDWYLSINPNYIFLDDGI